MPGLVTVADAVGFRRYWVAEHYSGVQSASPTLLAGLAAGLSDRIRVGTGGVLLRATSVLRVACDFAALEFYFPGRVDLGFAGALPAESYRVHLEKDTRLARGEEYAERSRRLVAMVRSWGTDSHPEIDVGPRPAGVPEIWLCGSSIGAAKLAGALSVSFAYHFELAGRDVQHAAEASREYLGAFEPANGREPCFAVAVHGVCAGTQGEATREWVSCFGDAGPRPSFVGSGQDAVEQLDVLCRAIRAHEVFVNCFASSTDGRVESLRELSSAAGLDGSV